MRTLDRLAASRPDRRRLGAPLLALAILAGCGGDGDAADGEASQAEPSTTVTPTSSAAAETSTTAAETTTTVDPEQAAWEALATWSGFSTGPVRSLHFAPELSFVVPDGSDKNCLPQPKVNGIALPEADGEGELPADQASLMIVRRDEPTVEATVAALTAGVIDPSEATPTTIGGAEGMTLTGLSQDDTGVLFESPTGDCTISFSRGEAWQFWVVDVAGEIVTLGLYAGDNEFEARQGQAEELISTVAWRDLG